MSIDILELNIALAKEFGVELEPDFWRRTGTFGEVVDEVARHMTEKKNDAETNQSSYDETLSDMINAVLELTGTKKNLDENTKLSTLVPFWRRHRFWRLLRERFPLLPMLESASSDRMIRILTRIQIPFFLSVVCLPIASMVQNTVVKFLLASVVLAGILCFLAAFPLAIGSLFALPCKRIGDAAKIVVERRRRQASVYHGDLTEVEDKLRKIFCHVLAAEPENVTRDAELSGDLKLS